MLTRKQHELLMFIHERIKESGVSPSFDEMKEALDLASKSGIHRLITALEERGFIRRLAHRARALEVVKLPQQATTAAPRLMNSGIAATGTEMSCLMDAPSGRCASDSDSLSFQKSAAWPRLAAIVASPAKPASMPAVRISSARARASSAERPDDISISTRHGQSPASGRTAAGTCR